MPTAVGVLFVHRDERLLKLPILGWAWFCSPDEGYTDVWSPLLPGKPVFAVAMILGGEPCVLCRSLICIIDGSIASVSSAEAFRARLLCRQMVARTVSFDPCAVALNMTRSSCRRVRVL